MLVLGAKPCVSIVLDARVAAILKARGRKQNEQTNRSSKFAEIGI